MDADRWRQISHLFHEACRRAVHERRQFLDRECAGDETLIREVELLLAQDANGESLPALPALENWTEPLVQSSLPALSGLNSGATLGIYRIERPLGQGGMGAVFLAYDTILHRQVALKVLALPLEY